jgi:hypothetical protein
MRTGHTHAQMMPIQRSWRACHVHNVVKNLKGLRAEFGLEQPEERRDEIWAFGRYFWLSHIDFGYDYAEQLHSLDFNPRQFIRQQTK